MLRRLLLLATLPLLLAYLLVSPCLASEPTTIDPDIDEGHRLFAHEKYEEALEHYLKALEMNEDDAELNYRIALVYLLQNNVEKKKLYFRRVAELDENIGYMKTFEVGNVGMMPTLLHGDFVGIDWLRYNYVKINKNDVVVFYNPLNSEEIGIGRIRGVPGDKVKVINKKLYINNIEELNKNNTLNDMIIPDEFRDFREFKVKNNKYFIVGDNLYDTYDSRMIGPINKNKIIGKVLLIFYSSYAEKNIEKERTEREGLAIE
jgi:signal peptidase I